MEALLSPQESFVLFSDGMLEPDSGGIARLWYPRPWPGSGSGNLPCQLFQFFLFTLFKGGQSPERERNSPKVTQQTRARLGPVSLKYTKKPLMKRTLPWEPEED